MAALNFPNPDVTQTYTEAGITWTWNATLGVWSSDDNDGFTETDADQRYLRIDAAAPDQTRVNGEATFAELTTHEAGVSVTGGASDGYFRATSTTDTDVALRIAQNGPKFTVNFKGQVTSTQGGYKSQGTTQVNWGGDKSAKFVALGDSAGTEAGGFVVENLGPGTDNETKHFYAKEAYNQAGVTNYAFYTAWNRGGDSTDYAFYAGGNAPNWFKGNVYAGELNPTNWASNPGAVSIFAGVSTGLSTITQSTANNDFKRTVRFQCYSSTSTANTAIDVGYIDVSLNNCTFDAGPGGQHTSTSDYRIKQNITPLSSAVDAVKALNPVSFNFTNGDPTTYQGFVAHELQEINSSYATGTKDATEAIGTLTDWDGTELETEVTEPEDLTYTEEVETDGVTQTVTRTRTWTATGTQPVYQGVDQTKLIPLLTKALQEALERIEALEAQLNP